MKLKKVFKEPEDYNGVRYWNANLIEFEGNEYIVSHKAILTLVTISMCNAACKFCSNDITFTPNGKFLQHNEKLDRILKLAKLGGVKKIAFSGGEPTANPQSLYNLCKTTIPMFEKSRIHTNGFGLLKKVDTGSGNQFLLDSLIELGLSGASLSIAHHDDDINQEIMRFKGKWLGLNEDSIREIASRSSNTFSIRMSCVLTSKGIKSVEDIIAYVEWGRSLGVKKFIFRSPSWIPTEYAKETAITRYNRVNHVDIDPITDELDKRRDFKIMFSEHKTDSHVHVYKYDNEITIDIDASSEEPDPDEKIRRLVVMPNEVLYKSWIDPLSNVFSDDRAVTLFSANEELPNLTTVQV